MRRRCETDSEISEKLKNLNLISKLKSKVFSGKVYLVGGAIRDLALGKKPRDFDFAISDAKDISVFEDFFKKMSFTLGKKPFLIHRISIGSHTIDLTVLNGTIDDDLKRRDLTINALAYDLKGERLIDTVGGLRDLNKRTLRFPEETVISLDPLRMLKAIRHYSTLRGFLLSEDLKEAIVKNRHLIREVAGERIKYELDLILGSPFAYKGIKTLEELGLLYEIFPELNLLSEFDKKSGLELKTMDHTIFGVKFLKKYSRLIALRKDELLCTGYALLFHDLGKPKTFSFDEKKRVVHFFGHEKVSVEMATPILRRLRFSKNEMRTVLELIKNHMRIFLLNKGVPTERATRRLLLRLGNLVPALVLLTLCDMFGTTSGKENETTKKILDYCIDLLNAYRKFVEEPPPKIINGYDLLAVGFEQGPLLGQALREIRERQLAGEIKTKEEALEYAKKFLERSKC